MPEAKLLTGYKDKNFCLIITEKLSIQLGIQIPVSLYNFQY